MSLMLCMANSRKNNGRCIAGIRVNIVRGRVEVLRDEKSEPIWIRPVCKETGYREIPHTYSFNINIFSLVEFNEIGCRPEGHQSENIEVEIDSIKVSGTCMPSAQYLDSLLSRDRYIFGDNTKSIRETKLVNIRKSLMLIKPENTYLEKTEDFFRRVQLRAVFSYFGEEYNLPITDEEYVQRRIRTNQETEYNNIYLTVSLGQVWHSRVYKLIVGVIFI